ncbi:hypothetical protein [Candidatus Albibeggiatoa sp. nov. NOAA]|uniref:hypothetical protein n=1 Tax=Candidatus Albibeggiatoa sp. nov. NOAA TaxID=3162724 RepID=UPI0032FF4C90|nr:hypothetical protein [Thiotrichaceae bacterium]
MLNEQGITYYSGMQSRENWQVNWENVKCIKVKLIYYVNPVLYVYTRMHDKPYKINIFQWVDSQTLDDTHIKQLGRKQLSISVTQTQFKELLSYAPLYQYFLTNSIPVQLPDSKNFNSLAAILKILVIASFILIFWHMFLADILLDHIFVPILKAFFMLIVTRC